MKLFGARMALGRPLQVSLVGGSLAFLLFRTAEEFFTNPEAELSFAGACPVCPLPEDWHVRSFAAGVLVGIAVGPIIDLLYFLRVSWGQFVRARLQSLRLAEPLYRILS